MPKDNVHDPKSKWLDELLTALEPALPVVVWPPRCPERTALSEARALVLREAELCRSMAHQLSFVPRPWRGEGWLADEDDLDREIAEDDARGMLEVIASRGFWIAASLLVQPPGQFEREIGSFRHCAAGAKAEFCRLAQEGGRWLSA